METEEMIEKTTTMRSVTQTQREVEESEVRSAHMRESG
jgi:hypothetical protein